MRAVTTQSLPAHPERTRLVTRCGFPSEFSIATYRDSSYVVERFPDMGGDFDTSRYETTDKQLRMWLRDARMLSEVFEAAAPQKGKAHLPTGAELAGRPLPVVFFRLSE